MKKEVLIIVNDHFDLMWRRPHKDDMEFGGQKFVSYAKLWSYYILDNMALCEKYPEYKFQIESVAVLKTFLEENPQHEGNIRKLFAEGRVYVAGSGNNIVDGNMVNGESLIRNFLYGLKWLQSEYGVRPKVAVRSDSFGHSAQLPQILRGFGMRLVAGLQYSPCRGQYWRGLDGSTVYANPQPIVGGGGGWRTYGPCESCKGYGVTGEGKTCLDCNGRGTRTLYPQRDLGYVTSRDWSPFSVDPQSFDEKGFGFAIAGGEEFLTDESAILWARANRDKYDVRFGFFEDLQQHYQKEAKGVDDCPQEMVNPIVDMSPNNTGCYVSRIKTKQNCRRQEYAACRMELLNTMACLKGRAYPQKEIHTLWEDLLFTMFHDAITGTHVDAAYRELQRVCEKIDVQNAALCRDAMRILGSERDKTVSIMNPLGYRASNTAWVKLKTKNYLIDLADETGRSYPILETRRLDANTLEARVLLEDMGPYEVRQLQQRAAHGSGATHYVELAVQKPVRSDLCNILQDIIVEDPDYIPNTDGRYTIENSRYEIQADTRGLLSIKDKKLGKFVSESGKYRPCELILEDDIGSPWTTLYPNKERIATSEYTTLLGMEKAEKLQRLHFDVRLPQRSAGVLDGISIHTTVTLIEGIDQLQFAADVHWDCFNQRLRIALPTPVQGNARYEIPYGSIVRQSYCDEYGDWTGAHGDWPTINWAGVESDTFSVALLNKGIPSYQVEENEGEKTILLSLLRSPTIPTYLHDPASYSMLEWDGMRDSGVHHFDCAVVSYGSTLLDSSIVLEAENYQVEPITFNGILSLPKMPIVESEHVRVSSVKISEDSHSIILRLVEYKGRAGQALLKLTDNTETVICCNLLEEEVSTLSCDDGTAELGIRPYEIATLSIKLKE